MKAGHTERFPTVRVFRLARALRLSFFLCFCLFFLSSLSFSFWGLSRFFLGVFVFVGWVLLCVPGEGVAGLVSSYQVPR